MTTIDDAELHKDVGYVIADHFGCTWPGVERGIIAIIIAREKAARIAALEECAQVCSEEQDGEDVVSAFHAIAAAKAEARIRELIEKDRAT